MSNSTSAKGFTLVELLIYIGMVSLVLVAMVTFSLRLAKARAKAQVVGEVQYNAKLIQDHLNDAMRHAEAINAGNSQFGTDPGVLSLDMADDALDPLVFSLDADDGSLQIEEAGGQAEKITTERVAITDLIFENLTSEEDVGVVRVHYRVQAVNSSVDPIFDYAQSYQTTIRIPLDVE